MDSTLNPELAEQASVAWQPEAKLQILIPDMRTFKSGINPSLSP